MLCNVVQGVTCYCATGAIKIVARADTRCTDKAMRFLADEIPHLQPLRYYSENAIVDYNDHPSTTKADILAAFDRAIAAAEKA